MRRIFRYALALPILALGILAAGGAAHAQQGGLPEGMTGTRFKLQAIQGPAQDLIITEDITITIEFDGKGLAVGNSTCNSYSAPYQVGTGNALTFGPLLSTMRACVDTSRQNLEGEYFSALQDVSSYSFDGTALQLFYNNGSSTLKFGNGATPIPGMPSTGAASTGNSLFLIGGGLALVLAGIACVTWARSGRTLGRQRQG